MIENISTIVCPMPLNAGSVNCYLIATSGGFILVDSGLPSSQERIDRELERQGCRQGDLRLIVITHGDFDHIGCAAHIRGCFGSKIAMHPDDAGMAERADMFWNRGGGNAVVRWLAPRLFGFTQAHRFSPDILAQDGFDLSPFGLEGCLLSLPGHSQGSIGLLTAAGDLFCGDLWMNDKDRLTPGYGDPAAFEPSFQRVKTLLVRMIFPGHGRPFTLARVA